MNINVPILPRSRGAQWDQPGTPSSATDDGGQGRQKHILLPETLINFQGNSEGNIGAVQFRVKVPDSRLRVKLSLVPATPPAGSATFTLSGKGLTLWLRDTEFAQQTGTYFPVTDLWGTAAVPGPIPGRINPATGLPIADPGLNGFSKEFVTAGDAIEGTVNYPVVVNNGKGQLLLQATYTPEAIRFPREEWLEIKHECGILIITPIGSFG